jgi:hypothetical protein
VAERRCALPYLYQGFNTLHNLDFALFEEVVEPHRGQFLGGGVLAQALVQELKVHAFELLVLVEATKYQ